LGKEKKMVGHSERGAALDRVSCETIERPLREPQQERVPRRPVSNGEYLNEAYQYERPSAFSRGMRVAAGPANWIFLSGTASIGSEGQTLHRRDFDAQLARTYDNLTALLASEGADWHDVVRTTVYLKDMDDYARFNRGRSRFFEAIDLAPPPASTCVQATLCREELLVEMELVAVIPSCRALTGTQDV